jgi:hypothetical protein
MKDQTDINRGFLKDKLGDYQVNPPDRLWDAISGQIARNRSRRGFYILLLASAASLALVITLGIHFFGPDVPSSLAVEMEPRQHEADTGVDQVKPVISQAQPVEREPLLPAEVKQHKNPVNIANPVIVAGAATLADQFPDTPAADNADVAPSFLLEAGEDLESLENLRPDPEPSKEIIADLLPDTAANLNTDPYLFMEDEKRRDPRWMIGAAVSPLYSYRDAEASALPPNPGESGLLSYSTGVHVSYRRNSRLAFETGIYYNKTGVSIGAPEIKIFNRSQDYMSPGAFSGEIEITAMNNSVGNIVAYSGDIYLNGYKINAENGPDAYANVVTDAVQASESGIQQHLDYLELPFNLRYSVIDRTIELQLVGGMSTNFLIDNYVTMEGASGQEEIGYLSNVNTFNLSGNAGVGMIYHMGKKFSILLEPRFRYYLNSVNDSSLPSTRPYSLGLYTGLSYTF